MSSKWWWGGLETYSKISSLGAEDCGVSPLLLMSVVLVVGVLIIAVAIPMMIRHNKKEPEVRRVWADPTARRG